ncbi:MAG: J domain-containing protein [Proteobacteria bacterium]|nr:J domain-containing protein [Pseudomonadota bacterium]
MRSAPLPPGVLLLLRLAAAESDAECEAEELTPRGSSANRDAAIFFIEQVLLSSNSDAYRVLGLDATATVSELRRHMAYLLKWLHPDLSRDPHKARLAQRVLVAWNEVKAAKRLDGAPKNGAHESLRKPANGGYRSRAMVKRQSAAERQGESRALRSRLARGLRRRVRPL